jgi:hypothetical protein
MISEGCPSGQREQTVNLPAYAYIGSNPVPSTILTDSVHGKYELVSASSSIGRASAFQAECRRFKPGLALCNNTEVWRGRDLNHLAAIGNEFDNEQVTAIESDHIGPGSSVVEHLLGKEVAVSSILILGSSNTLAID